MHDPFSSSIVKDSHTTKFKPPRRINENRPIEIMKRRIPPGMEQKTIKSSAKQESRIDYANIQRNIDDSLLEQKLARLKLSKKSDEVFAEKRHELLKRIADVTNQSAVSTFNDLVGTEGAEVEKSNVPLGKGIPPESGAEYALFPQSESILNKLKRIQ